MKVRHDVVVFREFTDSLEENFEGEGGGGFGLSFFLNPAYQYSSK